MRILKVNRDMYGVAFTDEGPLTDMNGDGNLVNMDTDEVMTWFDPVTETMKPYDSYGHFSIAGNIHLVLFETHEEFLSFDESFEVF